MFATYGCYVQCTQTSANSERANVTRRYLLWDEVKFFDRDPNYYCTPLTPTPHAASPNKEEQ